MTGSSRVVSIDKIDGTQTFTRNDSVAVEEPLEIQIVSADPGGAAARSIAVTMRTPGHDAELALGFLTTENIISNRSDVVSIHSVGENDPDTGLKNRIRVEIDPAVTIDLESLARHFYTTSSCGVCGKASIEALRMSGLKPLQNDNARFKATMLTELPDRVRLLQPLFSQTGGLHAAAIFDSDGEIQIVREDVGRHNATDKAIGCLLNDGRLPASEQGLLVSGRASFELVQKALVAGIPMLAAVGAPSSLAVQTAERFDMTLIGFLRNGTFNIYAHSRRILKGSG